MPWTLFDKITSLFNKNFLFSAFLPTLLFLVAVGVTLAFVIGVDATFAWFASLDPSEKAVTTAGALLGSVILAYVAAGLRPVLIAFWSGTLDYTLCRPFYGLATSLQRRHYDAVRARAGRAREWEPLLRKLRDDAEGEMNKPGRRASLLGNATAAEATTLNDTKEAISRLSYAAPLADITPVVERVARLHAQYTVEALESVSVNDALVAYLDKRMEQQNGPGVTAEWEQLRQTLIDNSTARRAEPGRRISVPNATAADRKELENMVATVQALSSTARVSEVTPVVESVATLYGKFDVDSLTSIYAPLLDLLKNRVEREQQDERDTTAQLDREFGAVSSIRATRLGNLIESYLAYPFRRYRMEGDVFWPALRSLVPKEYLAVLDESRVYVDFGVTMASYAGLYALLAIWIGPWLWWNRTLWAALGLIGLVTAYGFYWMAVMSVTQYGDIHRACIDLHRLLLMKALHRDAPTTLGAERAQWRELSQLAVYGDAAGLDFPLSANPSM